MPAKVFEDAIDLQIDLLEAILPTEEWLDSAAQAYPYPSLRPIGEQETRRFRTLILENEYLRVTLVPALGGRILSLFDKRTQTEVLSRFPDLKALKGGPRGVKIREGIQVQHGADPRPNSVGNVDSMLIQPETDEDAAVVWIAETSSGTPFGFHLQIGLAPDSAYLEFELRTQNRALLPAKYQGIVNLFLGEGSVYLGEGGAIFSRADGSGLAILSEPGTFTSAEQVGDDLQLRRNDDSGWLNARQVDTVRFGLVPFSGVPNATLASEHGVAALTPEKFCAHFTARETEAKLVVANPEGQPFEATIAIHPEVATQVDLSTIPGGAHSVMVKRKDGTAMFSVSVQPKPISWPLSNLNPIPSVFFPSVKDPLTRHIAAMDLAKDAVLAQEWEKADRYIDQALLYNGDDPLLWWAKAVIGRVGGLVAEDQERTDLLNAHFLSPLEPALRAEAFLSQEQTHGKDPNPIVAALEENPENFIEVACLLIGLGLYSEATRWIDEAVRHKNLGMLHILQASLYLKESRMTVQAGHHLQLAKAAQWPPYPYRLEERKAILSLASRFPEDPLIRKLAGWTDSVLG